MNYLFKFRGVMRPLKPAVDLTGRVFFPGPKTGLKPLFSSHFHSFNSLFYCFYTLLTTFILLLFTSLNRRRAASNTDYYRWRAARDVGNRWRAARTRRRLC